MKVIISQPRYLPALNYINRLATADKFVLLDTVQRQARGWENRNKLMCDGNPKWVSIPIDSSSRAIIVDTQVKGVDWIESHKNIVINYYRSAPFFEKDIVHAYYAGFEETLKATNFSFTELINQSIRNLGDILSFQKNVSVASTLDENRENWLTGPEELLRIADLIDATTYVSGPNAKDYGIEEVFREIGVKYHQFQHPEYNQETDDFIEYMGFFDAIFNAGVDKVTEWVNEELNLVENI